ncbi:Exopolyphosphatase [Mucinivorans hirudinis]|uniref:Exopolyphosphatase n=1 Tax=Mucinivorans hirudinis TaxID=1433126 RepID=A0A060RDJ4_9BACT|nr:Exopolyphosphatase [Mucinivorans hirudinis]
MLKVTPIGAIDIGSNAIRLQVTNVEEYVGETVFKKVTWIRIPLRLGGDVFTSGVITEQRRAHLLEVMKGFRHIMNAYDVKLYRACATSAMREAVNGKEIVDFIYQQADIKIEIIGGQQEADIIFASGLSQVIQDNNTYLFVDVGGGSTELTVFADGKRIDSRSFPVGTVRMLSGSVGEEVWKDIKKWLKFQMLRYTPTTVVGSGGNISKVQKMLSKKEKETMSYTEMKVLYDYIDSFTMEERVHKLRLNQHRADVIIPALKIFLTVMKCCKINQVVVPKMGMVEGITKLLWEGESEK